MVTYIDLSFHGINSFKNDYLLYNYVPVEVVDERFFKEVGIHLKVFDCTVAFRKSEFCLNLDGSEISLKID